MIFRSTSILFRPYLAACNGQYQLNNVVRQLDLHGVLIKGIGKLEFW